MCGHIFDDPVGVVAKDVTGKSSGFGKTFRSVGNTVIRLGEDAAAGFFGGPLGAAAMSYVNTPGSTGQKLLGGALAGGGAYLAESGALSSATDSLGLTSNAAAKTVADDVAQEGLSSGGDIASAGSPTGIVDAANALPAAPGGVAPATIAGGAPGAVAPAAPAAAPTSIDNFLSKPGMGTAWDVAKANPGAAVSALGLGKTLLDGNQQMPAEKALGAQAGALSAQGAQMMGYLNSGKLPPAVQQSVDRATQAQKAQIRQQYAAMGLQGSTMETQALTSVDQQATTQVFDIANNLVKQGVDETQISAQLYDYLAKGQQQQNSELSDAIAGFAASLAGGTKKAA